MQLILYDYICIMYVLLWMHLFARPEILKITQDRESFSNCYQEILKATLLKRKWWVNVHSHLQLGANKMQSLS